MLVRALQNLQGVKLETVQQSTFAKSASRAFTCPRKSRRCLADSGQLYVRAPNDSHIFLALF